MKKLYKISFIETNKKNIFIEAENKKQAIELAEKKVEDGTLKDQDFIDDYIGWQFEDASECN